MLAFIAHMEAREPSGGVTRVSTHAMLAVGLTVVIVVVACVVDDGSVDGALVVEDDADEGLIVVDDDDDDDDVDEYGAAVALHQRNGAVAVHFDCVLMASHRSVGRRYACDESGES